MTGLFFCYMFMQLVAPSSVTIAVATDAMICTINLMYNKLKCFSLSHGINF